MKTRAAALLLVALSSCTRPQEERPAVLAAHLDEDRCLGKALGDRCGVCAQCDASGGCTQAPADDPACGTLGWSQLPPATAGSLGGVWASGPSDLLALEGPGTSAGGVRIQRWNGDAWSETLYLASGSLHALWGHAATDVFALTTIGIFRWNGASWDMAPGGSPGPTSIWGDSATDAWAVGPAGVVKRWNGSTWSPAPSPGNVSLRAVWVEGPSRILAVRAANTILGGAVLEYDGASWTESAVLTAPAINGTQLNSLWGSGPGDVFAVGDGGRIFHHDGESWTAMQSGTNSNLRVVRGSGPADVWAAGDNGTLLHYDGAGWTPVAIGSSLAQNSLWVAGPDNVFLADAGGNVRRWGRGPLDCDGLDTACRDFADLAGARCAGLDLCKQPNTLSACAPTAADASSNTACGPCQACDGQGSCGPVPAGALCGSCGACDGAGACTVPLSDDHACGLAALPIAGSSGALRVVWGSGPGDVWAAGDGGRIVHANGVGSGWDTVTYVGDDLRALWGSGASNLWAAGAPPASGGSTRLWRWDGSRWSPTDGGTDATIQGLWGASPTAVFAVGTRGAILRLEGSLWSRSASGTSQDLRAVWGSSATNVWAVGAGGTILRWNGSSWFPQISPTSRDLRAVWGSGADDVWAVGAKGTVLRWNGSAWNEATTDIAEDLHGVWGTGPSNVYAVGIRAIHHWDGVEWERVLASSDADLFAVWGSGAADVFAVGNVGVHGAVDSWSAWSGGTLLPVTALAGADGSTGWAAAGTSVFRWDGASWSSVYQATQAVQAIWSQGSTVIAIGKWGVPNNTFSFHFDGSVWTPVDTRVHTEFNALAGTSPASVFAVGKSGIVLRWEGSSWRRMGSGTSEDLLGASAAGPRDALAVGTNGAIVRWDGDHWSVMASGTTRDLHAVWASGPADAFAVGESGAILHFDGRAWGSMAADTTANLHAVWGSGPANVFAAGAEKVGPSSTVPVLLRWDGVRWSEIQRGGGLPPLRALWGVGPRDLFTAGGLSPLAGSIWRVRPGPLRLDCDALDTACRGYQDVTWTTDRCVALGSCRGPNTEESCTDYANQPGGKECQKAVCPSRAVATPAGHCGFGPQLGLCLPTVSIDCLPFVCAAGVCKTACAGDADCASDPACGSAESWCREDGACACKRSDGDPCRENRQCRTKRCTDGVCCNVECTGPCVSCALEGSLGTCAPYPAGLDPERECGSAGSCGGTCDGLGSCQAAGEDQPCGTCRKCHGGACALVAAGTPCATPSLCVTGHSCNALGQCAGGASACDDANPCTTEICEPRTGDCANVPLPDGTVCPGADPCLGQVCTGGACGTDQDRVVACEDRGPCVAGACDPQTGQCAYRLMAVGTPCPDETRCNGDEVCDDRGVCSAGIPVIADDGDFCTEDLCNPATGLVEHRPKKQPCPEPVVVPQSEEGCGCAGGGAAEGGWVLALALARRRGFRATLSSPARTPGSPAGARRPS